MGFEVPRPLRGSVCGEIRRAADHKALHRAEPARDQARIRQIGDAHRDINAAGDEIDDSVVELQVDWVNGEIEASLDEIVEHFTRMFTAVAYAAIAQDPPRRHARTRK